jgi:iron(III) transport system substrate-binding protein
MQPVTVRLRAFLALLGLLALAAPATSRTALADVKAIETAASKEGELTWYVASIDARNAEKAAKQFTDKYGIKVNVVRAASQIMFQRLEQDLSQSVANADVFSSVDIGNFITLKANGALAAYAPENAKDLLPIFQNLDPDGLFHATVASVIAIDYNSDKVKDPPKSWTDLTDPKWAGKLALGHPAYSGFAGNWAAQMQKLYGKSYFERLEKLQPLVSRSLLDATNLLSSGERLVTASPISPILEFKDKGNPLAIQYPDDGAILVSTPSGILKNAPHPNAAKLFMEFLLGPEFNVILAEAHYETMRADVKPLPGAKSVAEIKVIRPTIEDSTKGIPAAAEVWRDVFGQ